MCKNPLAICNREGQRKLKKELKRVKMQYENEDIDDGVEEYKTETEQDQDQANRRSSS